MTDRASIGWRIAADTLFARAVFVRYVRPFRNETRAQTAERLNKLRVPRVRGCGPWRPTDVTWLLARIESFQENEVGYGNATKRLLKAAGADVGGGVDSTNQMR